MHVAVLFAAQVLFAPVVCVAMLVIFMMEDSAVRKAATTSVAAAASAGMQQCVPTSALSRRCGALCVCCVAVRSRAIAARGRRGEGCRVGVLAAPPRESARPGASGRLTAAATHAGRSGVADTRMPPRTRMQHRHTCIHSSTQTRTRTQSAPVQSGASNRYKIAPATTMRELLEFYCQRHDAAPDAVVLKHKGKVLSLAETASALDLTDLSVIGTCARGAAAVCSGWRSLHVAFARPPLMLADVETDFSKLYDDHKREYEEAQRQLYQGLQAEKEARQGLEVRVLAQARLAAACAAPCRTRCAWRGRVVNAVEAGAAGARA